MKSLPESSILTEQDDYGIDELLPVLSKSDVSIMCMH